MERARVLPLGRVVEIIGKTEDWKPKEKPPIGQIYCELKNPEEYVPRIYFLTYLAFKPMDRITQEMPSDKLDILVATHIIHEKLKRKKRHPNAKEVQSELEKLHSAGKLPYVPEEADISNWIGKERPIPRDRGIPDVEKYLDEEFDSVPIFDLVSKGKGGFSLAVLLRLSHTICRIPPKETATEIKAMSVFNGSSLDIPILAAILTAAYPSTLQSLSRLTSGLGHLKKRLDKLEERGFISHKDIGGERKYVFKGDEDKFPEED